MDGKLIPGMDPSRTTRDIMSVQHEAALPEDRDQFGIADPEVPHQRGHGNTGRWEGPEELWPPHGLAGRSEQEYGGPGGHGRPNPPSL